MAQLKWSTLNELTRRRNRPEDALVHLREQDAKEVARLIKLIILQKRDGIELGETESIIYEQIAEEVESRTDKEWKKEHDKKDRELEKVKLENQHLKEKQKALLIKLG